MSGGFLIDTNVVSEICKGARADADVRAWFDDHKADQLWLSVLVVGELRRGVELLRRRDKKAGTRLSEWLDTVTNEFADRIIPVTTEVCERWALLNVPDPLPVIDGLLARHRTRAGSGTGDPEHRRRRTHRRRRRQPVREAGHRRLNPDARFVPLAFRIPGRITHGSCVLPSCPIGRQ